MSMFNQVCRLAAVLALAAIPSTVCGQAWHPFADPMEFDPDWQFMAPVDADYLEELAPRKRANVGWFGTYDREYTLVSRSRHEAPNGGGDFTWANRYELGMMNQKDSGWLFTIRHMGGPNVYQHIPVPRINLRNGADTGSFTTPSFPSIGRNDIATRERTYILGDSLNVAAYSSFELNKTFRFEPYRFGGLLEPMLGLRYSNFEDYSLDQNYATSRIRLTDGGAAETNVTEILSTADWRIENRMLGGHLGFRYFNHVGRWTLSSEFRAFGMNNFRREEQRFYNVTTQYDGSAPGAAVVAERTTVPAILRPRNTTSFVPGFEVRAEAAYKLTKYIDLRGGVDFLNLAANIRRSSISGTNINGAIFEAGNNSVQLTGFSFGVAINR